jgi:hypothetical protein
MRDQAVHMQADHMAQYALGELPADQSRIVESHLQSCVDCGIQFEQSLQNIGQYNGPEQRKSPRVSTDDSAVLTVLKPERSERTPIRIVNTSKEGMRLAVPRELMTGSIVQVHVRDVFILAEVRYCNRGDSSFYAGVRIHDVFPATG